MHPFLEVEIVTEVHVTGLIISLLCILFYYLFIEIVFIESRDVLLARYRTLQSRNEVRNNSPPNRFIKNQIHWQNPLFLSSSGYFVLFYYKPLADYTHPVS